MKKKTGQNSPRRRDPLYLRPKTCHQAQLRLRKVQTLALIRKRVVWLYLVGGLVTIAFGAAFFLTGDEITIARMLILLFGIISLSLVVAAVIIDRGMPPPPVGLELLLMELCSYAKIHRESVKMLRYCEKFQNKSFAEKQWIRSRRGALQANKTGWLIIAESVLRHSPYGYSYHWIESGFSKYRKEIMDMRARAVTDPTSSLFAQLAEGNLAQAN